jgi:deoxyribose-phosphate aldolase
MVEGLSTTDRKARASAGRIVIRADRNMVDTQLTGVDTRGAERNAIGARNRIATDGIKYKMAGKPPQTSTRAGAHSSSE